jgi:hypothetical protein
MYVGADGRLTDTPVFLTPEEWGTIQVTSLYIEPDTVYDVQSDCGGSSGPENLSVTVGVVTYPFGDVDDSGDVDAADIIAVLDGFAETDPGVLLGAVDLAPCDPNDFIDLDDILAVLDAYDQGTYPCPAPCP